MLGHEALGDDKHSHPHYSIEGQTLRYHRGYYDARNVCRKWQGLAERFSWKSDRRRTLGWLVERWPFRCDGSSSGELEERAHSRYLGRCMNMHET
jgi:hypothetical protein